MSPLVKKSPLGFLVPWILLAPISSVLADETLHQLPPTVVTARPVYEEQPGSPAVSVLDPATKVPAGQVRTITDLLKDLGSLFVQDSSSGKHVLLRNLGDQDYRILLDGMPIGQMGVYYGRPFGWEMIPLQNIERIEVTRGAGSAENGNTLTGTINIVTKRGTEELEGAGRWSLGSFTDLKGGAGMSGAYGPLDFNWGGEYRQRNPYLENSDVRQWNIFSSLGYAFEDLGDLRIYGYTNHRNEGFVLDERIVWNTWSEARGLASGSDFDLDTGGVQVSWSSDWLDAAFSYTGQGRDDHYLRDQWKPGDLWDFNLWYKSPATKIRFHHPWRGHRFNAGFEYTYGDADTTWAYYPEGKEDGSFSQDLYGAFVEDTWSPLQGLELTLGLRYDYFENRISSAGSFGGTGFRQTDSGDGWSPRLTVRYDAAPGIQLYGFFGRLFKAPTVADLNRWYANYNLLSFPGRAVLRVYYDLDQPIWAPPSDIPPEVVADWQSTLGHLKPSKGYDVELGLTHSGDRFAYNLNLFYEYVDDYILIYPVSYPPTYNVDTVELWGLELSGLYTFSRWLEVEANYTFMKNQKRGDQIVEKIYGKDELFNAPEHLLNLFLRTRPLEGFMAEWQVSLASSRFAGGALGVDYQGGTPRPFFEPVSELGAYDIHNIHLTYSPGRLGPCQPRFSFAVENLFDRRDFIRVDYPLPGRLFYGGVELRF